MLKLVILILLALDIVFSAGLDFLARRQRKKPLPENVRDVYSEKQYRRFQSYSSEHDRLQLIHSVLYDAIAVVLFAFNLFAKLADALPKGPYQNAVLLILIMTIASELFDIPFDFISTMKIEQKYGFNRTTKKTFAVDCIKSLLIAVLIMTALTAGSIWLWSKLHKWFIIGLYLIIAVIFLLINMFSMTFMKLFNRFRPLRQGALRARLTKLFQAHGFQVREIYVMNASQRSTKANAFCAGLGTFKQIALYDTLVKDYSTEEIEAIFGHELAHFEHRDTLKTTLFQILLGLPVAALLLLLLLFPSTLSAIGFTSLNFGAVLLVAAILSDPVIGILSIPLNLFSRHCEYRADRGACEDGFGPTLSETLKKLSRDSLADLNPDRLEVALFASHPPLSDRLRAIEHYETTHAEKKGNQ